MNLPWDAVLARAPICPNDKTALEMGFTVERGERVYLQSYWMCSGCGLRYTTDLMAAGNERARNGVDPI